MKSFLVIVTLLAGCLAQAGLASLHRQVEVGDKVCFAHHNHRGIGMGSTEYKALVRAANNWQSFTSLEYGDQWGSLDLSEGFKEDCVYTLFWTCRVKARPCRLAE